jgi:hypothetical protein
MATPVDATTVSVTTDATPITTASCVVPAGDGGLLTVGLGAFSVHWSPYDRVGVVNAVP